MKPLLEKITNNHGSSFFIKRHDYPQICEMPFWHLHPEYEIVLINNGHGKRHIGNHVSEYTDGDLIFIGPNLPHSAFSNNIQEDNFEIVLQMGKGFVSQQFLDLPECFDINRLFERSRQGMFFLGNTKKVVGEALIGMVSMPPFERLLLLLKTLKIMAESTDYELLGHQPVVDLKDIDYGRIEKIYGFVEENFSKNISTRHLASHLMLSDPAFCRMFKKHTQKTFTQFLNQFRIDKACRSLRLKSQNISQIAFECGFQSLANFDKQFKKNIGTSPTQYRQVYKKVVSSSERHRSSDFAID